MNECNDPKHQTEKMVPKTSKIHGKHRKQQSEVVFYFWGSCINEKKNNENISHELILSSLLNQITIFIYLFCDSL